MSGVVQEDLRHIYEALSVEEKENLAGATVLVTGCAGFLGFYLMRFLAGYKKELGLGRLIGLDNFLLGRPAWLKALETDDGVELHEFNIINDDIGGIPTAAAATHILHMASIASPLFYRQYPLETVDANVWGLRRLLDFYRDKPIKGLAFFSSSEIYGDPVPEAIPTPEGYRGNVSCQGPRACYDEAKRFGETLCWIYGQTHGMPLSIIRPFNTYGPGMRLNDARVVADFALAVHKGEDIAIHSDGSPTRTYCYVSDAVAGYLKALLHGRCAAFNIGMDRPEITVKELAGIYAEAGREIFGYKGHVTFQSSDDPHYLTDNPNRRCPDISKARKVLGYDPQIEVREGVGRFLRYIDEVGRGGGILW